MCLPAGESLKTCHGQIIIWSTWIFLRIRGFSVMFRYFLPNFATKFQPILTSFQISCQKFGAAFQRRVFPSIWNWRFKFSAFLTLLPEQKQMHCTTQKLFLLPRMLNLVKIMNACESAHTVRLAKTNTRENFNVHCLTRKLPAHLGVSNYKQTVSNEGREVKCRLDVNCGHRLRPVQRR